MAEFDEEKAKGWGVALAIPIVFALWGVVVLAYLWVWPTLGWELAFWLAIAAAGAIPVPVIQAVRRRYVSRAARLHAAGEAMRARRR